MVDAPLNEAAEAYELDVLNGAGYIVRALASTTPAVTYTATGQTSNLGVSQGALAVARIL